MGRDLLGKRVKEKVTGIEGIVTAQTEYLFSTPQVRMTLGELCDGKFADLWVEETQVDVLEIAVGLHQGE